MSARSDRLVHVPRLPETDIKPLIGQLPRAGDAKSAAGAGARLFSWMGGTPPALPGLGGGAGTAGGHVAAVPVDSYGLGASAGGGGGAQVVEEFGLPGQHPGEDLPCDR
jgi:hypothetical protein